MAAIAEAKLDPGRTRSCVAAVAPFTEICTHWTARAARWSAAASSIRLPSVSIFRETPAPVSSSNSSQQKRHAEWLAAAKGDVRDAERRNTLAQIERLVATQFVAPRPVRSGFFAASDAASAATIGQLQAMKRGARHSSTERPFIGERANVLGKADIRLGHDLF
ncbi:MAG TPA: hypothetical protein VGG82_10835 [Casimicrobiaceae bacterium]